jgi:hypothetical protein
MKKLVVIVALIVGGAVAGYAYATPSSGTVVTELVRAATGEPFKLSVPQKTTVWQQVKVRQGGKVVVKRVQREKTVDTTLVSCAGASPCDFVIQDVTFQPGGESGWHSHPGGTMLIVKSGTLTRIEHDCVKETASAGQVMMEAGHAHDKGMLVRNETSQPAEAYVVYVVPQGSPLRIDQPAQCG